MWFVVAGMCDGSLGNPGNRAAKLLGDVDRIPLHLVSLALG